MGGCQNSSMREAGTSPACEFRRPTLGLSAHLLDKYLLSVCCSHTVWKYIEDARAGRGMGVNINILPLVAHGLNGPKGQRKPMKEGHA